VLKGRVNVEEAGNAARGDGGAPPGDIGRRPPESHARAREMGPVDANLIDELKKLFRGEARSCSLRLRADSSEGRWLLCKQTNGTGGPGNDCSQIVWEDAVQVECAGVWDAFSWGISEFNTEDTEKATRAREDAWPEFEI